MWHLALCSLVRCINVLEVPVHITTGLIHTRTPLKADMCSASRDIYVPRSPISQEPFGLNQTPCRGFDANTLREPRQKTRLQQRTRVLHVSPFPEGRRYGTGSAPAGGTTLRKSKRTSSCIELRCSCKATHSDTRTTHGGR